MAVDLVDILADGGGLKTLKSNLKERNESIEYNNNPLSTPLRPGVTTRRYDPTLRLRYVRLYQEWIIAFVPGCWCFMISLFITEQHFKQCFEWHSNGRVSIKLRYDCIAYIHHVRDFISNFKSYSV